MELIEEFGPVVAATAIGALIGVGLLGYILYVGDKNGVGFLEDIRDGLGG